MAQTLMGPWLENCPAPISNRKMGRPMQNREMKYGMRKAPEIVIRDCVHVFSNILPTSSILVAKVGKPPDVSQTHGKAEAGEDELDGVVPLEPTLGLGQGSIFCRKSGKIKEI